MTLRRVARALPLAFPVAYLAHEAASRDHTPGAAHAGALVWSLAGSLVLWLLAAVARGFFRRTVATATAGRYPVATLALAGLAGYAAIELGEGHGLTWVAALLAALAAVPAAALVAWLAAQFEARAFAAGAAIARSIVTRARTTRTFVFSPEAPRARSASQFRLVRVPGRAPPRNA